MMERSCGAAAVSVALVLATAGLAQADIIDQNVTLGLERTNWVRELTVNQLAIGEGTLSKVTLIVNASIQSEYKLENLQAGPSTQVLQLSGQVQVRRGDNSVLGAGSLNYSRSDTLAAYDGALDFSGASSVNTTIPSAYTTVTIDLTSPADLAMFIGNSTVTLPVTASVSSFFQGPSNVARNIQSLAQGNFRVIYDFIPVPAPAGLSVMAMGLVALGRRRG